MSGAAGRRASASCPSNNFPIALLTSSVVSTIPTHTRIRHHSTARQSRATQAAMAAAAANRWAANREWPRIPSFIPRKAERNWSRHRRWRSGRIGAGERRVGVREHRGSIANARPERKANSRRL